MTSSNNSDLLKYQETDRRQDTEARKFHGWRLLGGIMIVVTLLALASAIIDWAVIGPLEGRVF